MTPRDLLKSASRRLADAGVTDPEVDASLLLSDILGKPPLFLRLDTDTIISEEALAIFESRLQRRLAREPLQYILGTVPFQGLTLKADARALIPRPETSLLVDWAVACLSAFSAPRVLDLCCGTGCIGLSIRNKCPDALVTLSDLSPHAVSLSRENAQFLQLPVEVCQGDLFAPFADRRFHMIVSNPPYIASAACLTLQQEVLREPLMALDGGTDGLDFYRRIAAEAPQHLFPDGLLLFELGDSEAEGVQRLLQASGAKRTEIRKDLAGKERMILAEYP